MNIKANSILHMMLILIIAMALQPACSGQTGRMAGKGAASGAIVGAAGGVLSALVFGGDVADSAARGAVWGAGAGAAGGAMAGAQMDEAQKAKQEAELERLRKTLGDDAFKGLEALADCKHDEALGHAKTAAQSDNKDFALAGLWVEVLTHADRRQEDKARAMFPDIIKADSSINSEAQAEENMREALKQLMDIREDYKRPRVCK